VLFAGRKHNNVTDGDFLLLLFRCHQTFSGRHNQNLIAFVDVELVSDGFSEIDDT
jgi:hypothetical protein